MLAETFKLLVSRYQSNPQHVKNLWDELVERYSETGRYYHNLSHLDQVLSELIAYKDELADIDAVLFALYYHDAIYNILRKNNEEKSAVLAEERMINLRVPRDTIKTCRYHILATKAHVPSDSTDSNLFTDADLSILGQDWDTYSTYRKEVRQEYSVYPDVIYNVGRRKVLEQFLGMHRIFKTPQFYPKYELRARINIGLELDILS